MPWIEAFAVLGVCHAVGDFVLQTEFQATHKQGGLGSDPVARRALLTHIFTYALVFLPAFVWIASEVGALVIPVAVVVLGTHLVQDDGRLLYAYMRRVKKADPVEYPQLTVLVDQSMHFATLFAAALIAAS